LIGFKLATRPVFEVAPRLNGCVVERSCSFDWNGGFAASQKQKNVAALHGAYKMYNPGNTVLEISTKSESDLGVAHSAFNLKVRLADGIFPLECCYQSSKVFEKGGPFLDILNSTPSDAKRDQRLRECGNLMHFELERVKWPIQPETMFYDWLYMRAIRDSGSIKNLSQFDAFTDIEFNPKKSLSCQARSAAMAVSLFREKPENWLPDSRDMPSLYLGNALGGLF
jgi:type I restriction enzyme M protein